MFDSVDGAAAPQGQGERDASCAPAPSWGEPDEDSDETSRQQLARHAPRVKGPAKRFAGEFTELRCQLVVCGKSSKDRLRFSCSGM